MAYWLVKEEPDKYPFTELAAARVTDWTGVRNYQARNHLREMTKGDAVIYYHTGKEKAAVGTATVAAKAFPDPSAEDGDWSAVKLRAGEALPRPVPLKAVRADATLRDCALVKNTRLSVLPLTEAQYARFLELGGMR